MSILRKVSALAATPVVASAALAQLPAAVPSPLPNPSPIPIATAPPPLAPVAPFTSAPIPPAPEPIGIAPFPPPPGPTTTLWSFLGLSQAQREYRQRALARTPLGELRSKVQNPISKLTGGLIPPFPPEAPTLAELQAPGPIGAAAKAKLDRQTAKDRILAVQYLGTLDCTYWPEAEGALIDALRADRNEWVRLAAAQALNKGCCCTKKTIAALCMVVSCSNADGNPVEKSPRVVAAAQASLNQCLARTGGGMPASFPVAETPVVEEKEKPKPSETPGGEMGAAHSKPGPAGEVKGAGGLTESQIARPTGQEFYDRVAKRPWPELIAMAHHAMMAAPPIPVELIADLDPAAIDPADARANSPQPTNLMQYLTGPEPRSQMVQAQAVSPMRPPAPPQSRPAMLASVPAAAPTRTPPPAVPAAAPAQPVVASALPAATTRPPAAPTVPPARTRPAPPPTIAPTAVASRQPVPPPALPTSTPAAVAKAPVLQPVPAQSSRPMPVQAAKVMVMFVQPTDPRELEKEIDHLSAADLTGEKSIVPVLLRSAEDGGDTGVRAACVRALVRGKANSPAVITGLEKLVNDRSVDVRIEAAVGLNELKK